MRSITITLLSISLAVLAACSSDSSGGAGGAGGATGGSGGAGGGANGMCTNTADQAALNGTYADGGGITDVGSACAKTCLGKADFKPCTTTCIVAATSNAISTDCANCVTDSIDCTVQHCLSVCLADSHAPACVACQCGADGGVNCLDAYESCSGVPNTVCPSS